MGIGSFRELRDLGVEALRSCVQRCFENSRVRPDRSNLPALILDAMLSVVGCGTPKMVGVALDVSPIKITLNAKHHKSLLDLGTDGTADYPDVCIEAGASNLVVA